LCGKRSREHNGSLGHGCGTNLTGRYFVRSQMSDYEKSCGRRRRLNPPRPHCSHKRHRTRKQANCDTRFQRFPNAFSSQSSHHSLITKLRHEPTQGETQRPAGSQAAELRTEASRKDCAVRARVGFYTPVQRPPRSPSPGLCSAHRHQRGLKGGRRAMSMQLFLLKRVTLPLRNLLWSSGGRA
jgi:hypothetical protein